MIINVATEMKNILTASFFDSEENIYSSKSFDIFNSDDGMLNLVLVTSDHDIQLNGELILEFPSVINFKELNYNITSYTSPVTNIFYSLDGVNWELTNYYKITVLDDTFIDDNIVTDSGTLKSLFRKYSLFDSYIWIEKSNKMGESIYIINFYDKDMISFSISNMEDYWLLLNYFNQYFNTTNVHSIVLTPIFLKNESPIYQDKHIKFIKISLSGISINTENPLKLVTLSAMAEANIEYLAENISLLIKNMFRQSFFEDEQFLPSITKTFLEMLEQSPGE